MRVLGLVQRYGFGIPTARRELDKNGNPPARFEVTDTTVTCHVASRELASS
jgi:ATP-dependent DNA helicase RecG